MGLNNVFFLFISQYFIYTVMSPDFDPNFTQCIDYHIVTNNTIMWHIDFGFIFWMHYAIPLAVLISCYTAILVKIWSRGNGCKYKPFDPLIIEKL